VFKVYTVEEEIDIRCMAYNKSRFTTNELEALPWEPGLLPRLDKPVQDWTVETGVIADAVASRQVCKEMLHKIKPENWIGELESKHKVIEKNDPTWCLEKALLDALGGKDGQALLEGRLLKCLPATATAKPWDVAEALDRVNAVGETNLCRLTGVTGQRRHKQMVEILTKVKRGSQSDAAHWTSSEFLNAVKLRLPYCCKITWPEGSAEPLEEWGKEALFKFHDQLCTDGGPKDFTDLAPLMGFFFVLDPSKQATVSGWHAKLLTEMTTGKRKSEAAIDSGSAASSSKVRRATTLEEDLEALFGD